MPVKSTTKEWRATIDAAGKALGVDANNAKALYRRGVARSNSGELDGAKTDLMKVVNTDPKNKDARKQLELLREKIKRIKSAEKKKFGGMFQDSLYSDKEEEKKQADARKAAEAKAKQEAKEAEEAKWLQDWTEECTRRESVSEPEISWDDFKKEQEKKKKDLEEKEKAAKEAKQKEEERVRREAKRKQQAAREDVVRVEDEDDLGGIIKGYKKRADGTTTSYFDRELDETTKNLIGDFTPQAVKPGTNGTSPKAGVTSGGASAWNKGGTTWEERDFSGWSKNRLEELLKAIRPVKGGSGMDDLTKDPSKLTDLLSGFGNMGANGGLGSDTGMAAFADKMSCAMTKTEIEIMEVKDVKGDASVAVVRGKPRAMFDWSFELEWSCTVDNDYMESLKSGLPPMDMDLGEDTNGTEGDAEKKVAKTKKYKGKLLYHDVSLASNGTYEGVNRYKKSPADKHKSPVEAALESLRAKVTAAIETTIAELKAK